MKRGVDYIGVAAGMVLINDQWEIFLAQRWKDVKNEAWKWECAWGWVDHWETRETTVVREAKEEFNIHIEVVDTLWVFEHIVSQEWHHRLSTTYLCRIVSGTPQIMEPDKCNAIAWVHVDEVSTYDLSVMAKLAIDSYINYKSNRQK